MNSDAAARRAALMWARLGNALSEKALERAKTGNRVDCEAAVHIAKLAEVCWWQATGEMDCLTFENVGAN